MADDVEERLCLQADGVKGRGHNEQPTLRQTMKRVTDSRGFVEERM